MKEKRRLRRIKVGCKILDTRTEDTHTHTHTHTRTVVLDDLIEMWSLSYSSDGKMLQFCIIMYSWELYWFYS